MERRLTTILAADVVGYSRLMGEDEAGTLAALKSLRRKLVKPKESMCGKMARMSAYSQKRTFEPFFHT